MRRIPAVAASILVSLTLASCSSDPTSPPTTTAPSMSPTSAPAQPTIAAATDLVPDRLTVAIPEGWKDTSTPTFRHFLAPDVASDPVAERWGDILIYEATSVIEPTTGEQQPLPDDVADWLRANPTMDVLDEGTVQVDGRSAVLIDAGRPKGGSTFNGPEVSEAFVGIHERYILIPVGERWVVVQASTFRGPDGLAEPDQPSDALAGVLESIEISEP